VQPLASHGSDSHRLAIRLFDGAETIYHRQIFSATLPETMKFPTLHRPSWKTRRTIKLWLIWLVFSLISAVVLQGLSRLRPTWLPGLDETFVTAQLNNKFGVLAPLQGIPGIAWLARQAIRFPQAVFGFVSLGGLATVTLRARCHDRFLASFNDDVLTPVGEQQPPRPRRGDGGNLRAAGLDPRRHGPPICRLFRPAAMVRPHRGADPQPAERSHALARRADRTLRLRQKPHGL
jgi:hypothetical protein